MILSIIVILLLLGIAYFYYAQGLFSATTAAFCAGVAALVAFGFHESVARLGNAALGSYADAVALAVLFALTFLVLRFLIDNYLPGNVRYPVALEKVGAGVMGLVAAFFATAMVALVANAMPFGPTVAMYGRYETVNAEVSAPRNLSRMYRSDPNSPGSDVMVYENEVAPGAFGDPSAARSLWVPVDRWFVSLAAAVGGEAGSLAGPGDFDALYPGGYDAYADAVYGRRLGIQAGASHAAINVGDDPQEFQVRLAPEGGLFRLGVGEGGQFPEGVPQVDGDLRETGEDPPDVLRPGEGQALLVARLLFSPGAADDRALVRFSPASARLVVGGAQYFPVATLESSAVAVAHRPDDYLLAQSGADLVYEVPADALAADGTAMPEGAFLEFKELARVPLGEERVYGYLTGDARTQLERKVVVKQDAVALLQDVDVRELRTTEEFDLLREALPGQAPSAAEAEAAYLEGLAPPQGTPADVADEADEAPAPADDAPAEDAGDDEEPAGTAGILGGIRDKADERNDEIGGDE